MSELSGPPLEMAIRASIDRVKVLELAVAAVSKSDAFERMNVNEKCEKIEEVYRKFIRLVIRPADKPPMEREVY